MSAEMDTTRKSILTPFNIIATVIVIVGLYATFVRFTQGLDASTNFLLRSATRLYGRSNASSDRIHSRNMYDCVIGKTHPGY